jgi:hypothetical protein
MPHHSSPAYCELSLLSALLIADYQLLRRSSYIKKLAPENQLAKEENSTKQQF